MELDFRIAPGVGQSLLASYSCPCGCAPSVTYQRGAKVVTDSCRCGNEFAVGPDAEGNVRLRPGYHLDRAGAEAPWGETVPVAWAIGPSMHESAAGSSGEHHHEHSEDEHEHGAAGWRDAETTAAGATDPVCGMTVNPEDARTKGLHSSYKGADYFFCGKGCKLEFDEDPERYLDPSHVPSM